MITHYCGMQTLFFQTGLIFYSMCSSKSIITTKEGTRRMPSFSTMWEVSEFLPESLCCLSLLRKETLNFIFNWKIYIYAWCAAYYLDMCKHCGLAKFCVTKLFLGRCSTCMHSSQIGTQWQIEVWISSKTNLVNSWILLGVLTGIWGKVTYRRRNDSKTAASRKHAWQFTEAGDLEDSV